MDKASRAIRRSGVKLLSLGGGHSNLNVIVSDINDIRNCAKAFMNAQHLAAQDMSRWSAHEENRAIQDVVSSIADLMLVWTDVQKTFIGRLKDYRYMFEMVLEGEKDVSQANDNLNYCVEKETKVRKEMKKVTKRASAGELKILQCRVEHAEKAKEVAQIEVSDRVRENEAVKLIRLKGGLLKMSGAYMELACQCNTIFTAERDISIQLPDVHGRDVENIKYSGAVTTRFIVEKAREKVQSYSCADVSTDPPPPYTPPGSDSRSSSQGLTDVPHNSSTSQLVIYDTPIVRHSSGQPRHSIASDTPNIRLCSGGASRPRSRSDNTLRQSDHYSEASDMPSVRSSHSLSGKDVACSAHGIARGQSGNALSAQEIAQDLEMYSSKESIAQNAINEQAAQTFVHTNIVQIRQVIDMPAPESTSAKVIEDIGADYGRRNVGMREASEHSSDGTMFEENFQYADEANSSVETSDRLRPVPAPRRRSSGADYNEGYQTAEEYCDG